MNSPTPQTLRQRLLELPFDAYLKLLSLLLVKIGYYDIRLAGRTDWKGRNKSGGFDLIATLATGYSPRHIIIQAKQFDTDSRVFQRQADELRGAAIRVGAAEALLITSGPISRSIDLEGLSLPLAPVRLIGGEHLLDLLATHQVGVTSSGQIDDALFTRLEQEAIGNRQSDCSTRQSDCLGASELLLTVAVKRVPRTLRRIPKRAVVARHH